MADAAPLRVAVGGCTGRMGRAIAQRIATARDLTLVGGTGRTAGEASFAAGAPVAIVRPADAASLLAGSDVVVDVSSP
ncbi:MAG: hypothetical protein ACRELX_07975, partial [Longimicrobiales bacterium]